MERVPRCIALHDLSCFGRCALAVVIPVLAAQGIQPCPVPTALLSTHSGVFTDYTFLDLTEQMEGILEHWCALGLRFEYLYTGFLGSPKQVGIVRQALQFVNRRTQGLYLFDPVLGDDGEIYNSLDSSMVEAMQALLPTADLLTPNLTELFLLAEEGYRAEVDIALIDCLLKRLAAQGPKKIVVTSCPNDRSGNWVHSRVYEDGRIYSLYAPAAEAAYPGTGDLFASVLLGQLGKQTSFAQAVQRAMDFVSLVLLESVTCPEPWHHGLQIEAYLDRLAAWDGK